MVDWEGYLFYECVFYNDIRRLLQFLCVNDVLFKDMYGIILFFFLLFQFYCQLYFFYVYWCENYNVNIIYLLILYDLNYLYNVFDVGMNLGYF